MNDKIRSLLAQIQSLDEELRTALHEQETHLLFEIKGKHVVFEQAVVQAHRKLKRGFVRWVVTDRPQNLITGPIIYSMIIPLIMTDILISLYQWICFPIYQIARVRRADFVVFDRRHLQYLNGIEKFHCTYCEYANGVIAYIQEVIAKTEQYFCPIKHARKVLGTHTRYAYFLDYGDADDYEAKLEKYRTALGKADNIGRPDD
ncbi:MAG: hypothetical protein M0Z83_08265 [Betaproteobacteria bacterium]|nr:hypothetical protein [Betaproteobacteria bacterium]